VILGIFPEQGGSISNLKRTGQDGRFIRSYLGNYAKAFEKVYYFSYANENPQVPDNCYVIKNPGFHRWVYAFLLPFVQREFVLECDVFRVMQMYGAIPAIVTKILHSKPFVGTYGYRYYQNAISVGEGRVRAALLEARARLGLRFADRVIVTSPQLARLVGQYVSKSKVLFVPNGVDTSQFHPLNRRTKAGVKRIIFVGRFSQEKNLPLLIEAAALLDGVKLVLVGDGPMQPQIEKLAAQLQVEAEFTGVVPHEQLPALLNQSDIFVLPSLSEGHPKALLEAMSCGLPCIGTNVPGIRDVIRDEENGLLCELAPKDLADKIAAVLSNSELRGRLGRAGRRLIKVNFDLDTLLGKEIEVMRLIARGNNW